MSKDRKIKRWGFSLGNLFKKKKRTRMDMALARETTWFYILVATLVVNVLSLAGNFYLFVRLSADEALVTPNITEEHITTINRGELEGTIRFFEERKGVFESLQNIQPSAIDPSRAAFGPEESTAE